LLKEVQAHFTPSETYFQSNKGHGRIEKRIISIGQPRAGIRDWPGLNTLIKVESVRITRDEETTETRYYISSLRESAKELAQRIRGYWGVENKVHYVRDVTQGEDKSRIRTAPLVQIWALARNFALNLYRTNGFVNMAQAQRKFQFGFEHIQRLFRMK
jgi:predicted transposase YbfD/YdcC